jgi:hypothetical protein
LTIKERKETISAPYMAMYATPNPASPLRDLYRGIRRMKKRPPEKRLNKTASTHDIFLNLDKLTKYVSMRDRTIGDKPTGKRQNQNLSIAASNLGGKTTRNVVNIIITADIFKPDIYLSFGIFEKPIIILRMGGNISIKTIINSGFMLMPF